MSTNFLAEMLGLPEEERARLAQELIASLDGPPDADAERAWLDEIVRRAEEVRAGTADLTDWQEARKRILDSLRKP